MWNKLASNYWYNQIIFFTAANYRNLTMRSQVHISPQDVIRCDLCDTPVPTKHCDVCHIHLCEECEGRHLSDESNEHVIVSFEMRGSTPKCSKHSNETCVRYCKTCNTSICASCDSLGRHKRHKTEHISKMSDLKKEPKRDESQTTVKLRCSSQIREPYVSSGKHKQRVGYK